jgi:hypothetical protein
MGDTEMTSGPTRKDAIWALAGAAIFAALFLLIWHFRQDPAQVIASKAARVDLVGRMQAGLSAASEAEKSAVLAVNDPDSQAFADQARAATAEVERARTELEKLTSEGAPVERQQLAQFSEAFARLRMIDDQVLDLAVRNTNVKAYGLAFGPAADTLDELDAALSRVAARKGSTPDSTQVLRLASGARIAVLRIQSLLAPHIAEESDAKMSALEARMTKEEAGVRGDLAALAALPALAGDADLQTAASRFARYVELKARILALSRENTNVQSLALSLNQKRKAMVECLAALGSLKQAILEEPIPGVPYGRVPTR